VKEPTQINMPGFSSFHPAEGEGGGDKPSGPTAAPSPIKSMPYWHGEDPYVVAQKPGRPIYDYFVCLPPEGCGCTFHCDPIEDEKWECVCCGHTLLPGKEAQ
jgi:hypothetical protein